MHATADAHRHHHVMPTSGGPLTRVALSATLHCLTGCAIGEVLGMIVGTALGFSNLGTSVARDADPRHRRSRSWRGSRRTRHDGGRGPGDVAFPA